MDSNSDDSAAAMEKPDDSVWPPPPSGFEMPRWASTAWHCLLTAVVLTWCGLHSPPLVQFLLKVQVGLLLYVLSWPFFGLLFTLGLEVYFIAASAVIGPNYSRWHTTGLADELAGEMRLFANTYPYPSPMPVAAVMRIVGLRAACRLMFFVWGLSFLLGSHRPLITRIAFVLWIGLLAAGVGVLVVNNVKQWLLRRRQSRG